MKLRILLAVAASAAFASLALVDCHLEIRCDTAENCEAGQVCVSGLCQDAMGTDGGGAGGAGGNAPASSASSGAGGARTSSSAGSTSSSGSGSTSATSTSSTSGVASSSAASSSVTSSSGGGPCPGGCPAGDYCDAENACAACSVDAHCGSSCAVCSGSTPRCNGTKCVQCTTKSDCAGQIFPCCSNGTCSSLGPC